MSAIPYTIFHHRLNNTFTVNFYYKNNAQECLLHTLLSIILYHSIRVSYTAYTY